MDLKELNLFLWVFKIFFYLENLILNLGNNQIGKEGAFNLACSLGKMLTLSSLNFNLSNNNLGIEGAKLISNQLDKLV